MDEQLKQNLTSKRHWMRLIFMVLFALLLQVAALVMWALVAVQFVWALVTGSDNDQLRRFGHSLATFIYEALQFLTYNTEHKPFPFADWPDMGARRDDIASVNIVAPAAPAPGDEIVENTRDVVEDVEHQQADDTLDDQDPDKR